MKLVVRRQADEKVAKFNRGDIVVAVTCRTEASMAELTCSGFGCVELYYHKIKLVEGGVSLVPTDAIRNRGDASVSSGCLHSSFAWMVRSVLVLRGENGNQSSHSKQKQQTVSRFYLHEADNDRDNPSRSKQTKD